MARPRMPPGHRDRSQRVHHHHQRADGDAAAIQQSPRLSPACPSSAMISARAAALRCRWRNRRGGGGAPRVPAPDRGSRSSPLSPPFSRSKTMAPGHDRHPHRADLKVPGPWRKPSATPPSQAASPMPSRPMGPAHRRRPPSWLGAQQLGLARAGAPPMTLHPAGQRRVPAAR